MPLRRFQGASIARAALAWLALCGQAEAGTEWVLAIVGRDELRVTVADRSEPGNPLVDPRAVAPAMGLTVGGPGHDLRIVDGSGRRLSVAPVGGARSAEASEAYSIIENGAVFVALKDLVRHRGGRVVIGANRHAYVFLDDEPDPAPSASTGSSQDLAAFVLPKTPEELADARRLAGLTEPVVRADPRTFEVLPPQHDSLHVDVGAGVVTGHDGAADITASGTISGFRVGVRAFAAIGQGIAEARLVHMSLKHPDGRWLLEGGDLVTELRGLSRGVRLSGRFFDRWHPGVAVYLKSRYAPDEPEVVAYRDEIALTPNSSVYGEVASDRSFFVGMHQGIGRVAVETFYRQPASRPTRDYGTLVSINLGRGFSANAGARMVAEPEGDESWVSAGLRIPMGRSSSLSLDQTRIVAAGTSRTASGVGVTVPIGSLRLMQRYQWSDVVLASKALPDQRLVQSMAFWAPTRRLQLSYQTVTQWYEGGEARQWDQADASVEVTRGTTFRVSAKVPEVTDVQYLRLQLTQALPKNFAVSVEYGALSAFHPRTPVDPTQPRFLVMLRRRFDVRTPAAGGRVTGTVVNDTGRPVPGVAVRMGQYVTTSDAAGWYEFRHVPPGTFSLGVDRARLAAVYAPGTAVTEVPVERTAVVRRDLRVVPLDSLGGLVYVDDNRNDRPDPGEEQQGVVVHADGRATVTDEFGQYRFYNLASRVSDDGVGLPELRPTGSNGSLGHRLVESLAQQVGGVFSFVRQERGTEARLTFTLDERGPRKPVGDGASLALVQS